MKEKYISDLSKDMELTEFFMVKSAAIKLGSNKKQYLDVTLGDKTGEVSSKKWDIADGEMEFLSALSAGDIIKVKAQVTEWQGVVQLRIGRIRKVADGDEINISDFIKAAPEDPEDMFGYIFDVAEHMEDGDLKALCEKVLTDNKEKLMYYPAASKNHHAEYAGLLYHIKRMLMTGMRVCEVYTDLDRDLVCAGVILHDIEKLNEILSDRNGMSSGYSFEGQMLGHLVQGVKALDRWTRELNFPEEKAIMLEHMVLSHHYEPEFGSPKKPLFPEAELLHYLDVLDARMFDMGDALSATKQGEFSERIWTLDNRRLYKPL